MSSRGLLSLFVLYTPIIAQDYLPLDSKCGTAIVLADIGSTGIVLFVYAIATGSGAPNLVTIRELYSSKKIKGTALQTFKFNVSASKSDAEFESGLEQILSGTSLAARFQEAHDAACAPCKEIRKRIAGAQTFCRPPVLLYATAGMRSLPSSHRQRLLRHFADWVSRLRGSRPGSESSEPQFLFDAMVENSRTITGETEAYYAFLAVNLLLGSVEVLLKVRHPGGIPNLLLRVHGDRVAGMVELGGSSAQIGIVPGGVLMSGVQKLDTQEFRLLVFTRSYSNFGMESAVGYILSRSMGKLESPCTGNGTKFESCVSTINHMFLAASDRYNTGKLRIPVPHGSSLQIKDSDFNLIRSSSQSRKIFLLSTFFSVAKDLRTLGAFSASPENENENHASISVARWKEAGAWICAKSPSELEGLATVRGMANPSFALDLCLQSSYIYVLLSRLGFSSEQSSNSEKVPSLSSTIFVAAGKIDGEAVGWPRGAYLDFLTKSGLWSSYRNITEFDARRMKLDEQFMWLNRPLIASFALNVVFVVVIVYRCCLGHHRNCRFTSKISETPGK